MEKGLKVLGAPGWPKIPGKKRKIQTDGKEDDRREEEEEEEKNDFGWKKRKVDHQEATLLHLVL